jgi:hypothetical protein
MSNANPVKNPLNLKVILKPNPEGENSDHSNYSDSKNRFNVWSIGTIQ